MNVNSPCTVHVFVCSILSKYIRMITNAVNIYYLLAGFQDNFKIVEDGETSTQGMAYDFDSVMHYDAYAFSSNHRPTITPLDRTVRLGRLGQRRLLSSTDIAHLKAMYPKGQLLLLWGCWKRILL